MQKFNLQGTLMAIAITFAVVSCNKNQDKIVSTATNPANATESMISENGANPEQEGTEAAIVAITFIQKVMKPG